MPSFAPFQALRASAGSRALTIMNRGCCIGNRGGLCVLLLLVMGGFFVSDCNRGFLTFCGVASLFGNDANQKDKLIRRMFFIVLSFSLGGFWTVGCQENVWGVGLLTVSGWIFVSPKFGRLVVFGDDVVVGLGSEDECSCDTTTNDDSADTDPDNPSIVRFFGHRQSFGGLASGDDLGGFS